MVRLEQDVKEFEPKVSRVDGIVIVLILIHPRKAFIPRTPSPFIRVTDVNPTLFEKQESPKAKIVDGIMIDLMAGKLKKQRAPN